MKVFASLFTGFGLADVGARAAGFESAWGNEIDPRIAEVATANGSNGIIVADMLKLDPRRFERPDWFHASPVCTRASSANQSAELNEDGLRESPLDIAMAEKVAEFIRYLRPPHVTIENVQGYKRFKSFKLIIRALADCGYMYDVQVLCAADFGVPQTRRRLVVRAILGGLVPYLPAPVEWVGWYAAIEDIIHTLPERAFAEWQLARLPEFLDYDIITRPQKGNPKTERGAGYYAGNLPAPTVMTENPYMKSFIVDGSNATKLGKIYHFEKAPANTVTSGGQPKAFLVDGQSSKSKCGLQILQATDPAQTVTASAEKHPARAWLKLGHVVKMTPHALARFQSVPDWFELPDSSTLAVLGIGNGCPPLMWTGIGESWQ